MTRRATIFWATHPRHLPPPPPGRVVVVDVAFAAGRQYRSKTMPFIEALGARLVRWIDHHEHREAWAVVEGDARFVLVPNRIAHACPELVTPARVCDAEEGGPIDSLVAHCDFDGLVAAVKWRCRGREPWPGADEDARAVDSPGRGHCLSAQGERLAFAMEEASAAYARPQQTRFMSEVADALTAGEESFGLADEVDQLAAAARKSAREAIEMATRQGREEVPGVFVVRLTRPVENRLRKHLLMAAEERAPVGALVEPDPQGGAWVTAATFDERIDLEKVEHFEGGRSDYRFARARQGGQENIEALGNYLRKLDL